MAKSNKSDKPTRKASVKVQDLAPQKNPKGGQTSLSDFSITKKLDKSTP